MVRYARGTDCILNFRFRRFFFEEAFPRPIAHTKFKNLPAKQKENENAMGEGGHSDFVGVDGILKISTLVERRN